jgi:hypothetical protein
MRYFREGLRDLLVWLLGAKASQGKEEIKRETEPNSRPNATLSHGNEFGERAKKLKTKVGARNELTIALKSPSISRLLCPSARTFIPFSSLAPARS